MNTACAIDILAFEKQLAIDTSIAERLDTALLIEPTSRPTGVFASDCCGSNNYEAN